MNKKGFTLVELLAVIAILAILVIIALPNVLKMFNNAKKNTFLTEVKTMYNNAANKYITERIKGKKLDYISSDDDTKLDMTGKDLQYYILLNDDGSVNSMKVYDGNYYFELNEGEKITDVTTDDIEEKDSSFKYENVIKIVAKSFEAETDWLVISNNAKKCVNNPDSCPYKVGDTKTVDLSTYGTHTLRIANIKTLSECSTNGFSQSACGFVIEFADVITTKSMRSDGATNVGGWTNASIMKNFLDNDVYDSLPESLREIIISTKTVSSYGTSDSSVIESNEKLFLLASKEIWKDIYTTNGQDNARDNTRQLDFYEQRGVTAGNSTDAIKKEYNGTTGRAWWLRSAASNYNTAFLSVAENGEKSENNANKAIYVSPAFRIASK